MKRPEEYVTDEALSAIFLRDLDLKEGLEAAAPFIVEAVIEDVIDAVWDIVPMGLSRDELRVRIDRWAREQA